MKIPFPLTGVEEEERESLQEEKVRSESKTRDESLRYVLASMNTAPPYPDAWQFVNERVLRVNSPFVPSEA